MLIPCVSIKGNIVKILREKIVFRPSVYGVIFNKGKILMLRTKSNGKYFFPGGGIEPGEKMKEALHREIKEEVGITVKIGKLLHFKEQFFYYDPGDEAFHMFNFFFLCSPITNKLISDNLVDDLESEKPRWLAFNKLKNNPDLLDATAQEVVEILLKNLSFM